MSRFAMGTMIVLAVWVSVGCATPEQGQAKEPQPTAASKPAAKSAAPREAMAPTESGNAEAESQAEPAVAEAESKPTPCDDLEKDYIQEYYSDGQIRMRQEIVHDKDGNIIPHGATLVYWEDGAKKLKLHYRCGVKHGRRTAWHANGEVWSTGAYVDGLDHGTWTKYYPDGVKAHEFTMQHGKWHGVQTRWHPNGVTSMQVDYVNGLRQGMLTNWDENGAIIDQTEFVDNKPMPTPTYPY